MKVNITSELNSYISSVVNEVFRNIGAQYKNIVDAITSTKVINAVALELHYIGDWENEEQAISKLLPIVENQLLKSAQIVSTTKPFDTFSNNASDDIQKTYKTNDNDMSIVADLPFTQLTTFPSLTGTDTGIPNAKYATRNRNQKNNEWTDKHSGASLNKEILEFIKKYPDAYSIMNNAINSIIEEYNTIY